jgi:tol-pal system protein YbgF
VSGGCATKGDVRALQVEVRAELQAQAARQDSLMTLLERQAASTQDTLSSQSDQLVDFRGDITRLLRSISDGMTRLEAIVGENQRGIATVRAQLASGGATTGAPATGPGLVDSGAVTTRSTETVAGVGGGTSSSELYQIARSQHQRGSLSAAQQAYEQFLEEFPNDPLAADARFFLADLLVQQGRPEDALEQLQEIPRVYPAHERVPDALFRIARLQVDLGNTEDARDTLQRLINTYPDSSVTFLAEEMLEGLS